jgi:hypothetical protein
MKHHQWKYARISLILVIAGWIIYATLNLLAPQTTSARYQLSPTQTLLLQISVYTPLLIIWVLAIRGATAFKSYSLLLQGGREARAMSLIGTGLLWTVVYLLSSSLTGAIVPYFQGTQWLETAVTVRNHAPAWTALIAFGLLYLGSRRLSQVAPFATWNAATIILLIGYGLFAAGFANTFLAAGTETRFGIPSYALPHQVLLFTMLLPYLLAWFLGLLAAINLTRYAAQVKGVLYRQALRYLVLGVLSVVIFAVIVQVLSLASRFFLGFDLARLLFTVYVLLALYGLGFWFVNLGARNLARIENAP